MKAQLDAEDTAQESNLERVIYRWGAVEAVSTQIGQSGTEPVVKTHLSSKNTLFLDTSTTISRSPYSILDADNQPTSSRCLRLLSVEGRTHAQAIRRLGFCNECRRKMVQLRFCYISI